MEDIRSIISMKLWSCEGAIKRFLDPARRRRPLTILFFILFLIKSNAGGLPCRYEELTALQLAEAIETARGTILLPLGILEKHGPHLPLGTDLLNVREMVFRAVAMEYSVVFPPYYVGQIYEAKHQLGTIAYSPDVVWRFLQETCDELGRNGFRKIILVNGHGGNTHFLSYFCQAQLAARKDYAVVLFSPQEDPELEEKILQVKTTTLDAHAGETETSMMMAHRPDLVHLEWARRESGMDQDRLAGLPHAYTGIWWYARFPNHYAGDGGETHVEIGNWVLDDGARQLADLIRHLKEDDRILELQNQFFDAADHPVPIQKSDREKEKK